MELLKFDSGIYPIIPGMDINLGDYGYFDGPQWNYMGNLELLLEGKRVLSTSPKGPQISNIIENTGVSINGEIGAKVAAEGMKAGLSFDFSKENSQLFLGRIVSYKKYTSPEVEIKPILDKLLKNGKWNSKYWLAVYVIYSDNFVFFRSKKAGASIKLTGDLLPEDFCGTNASLFAKMSFDSSEIEQLSYSGEKSICAGAKFISLNKTGFFKKSTEIKFNETNPNSLIIN